MKLSWKITLFFIVLCFLASGSFSIENFHQAFPIIEPDPGHTKLRLSREGLEAIEKITTPIAAVAVIGPYRSGKSFTLNQLLSLSCDEGFGVGHMRDTKTKGIWVWGTPVELDIDGVKTSVFYLDTEGFESIGKSNVYDDRIFALAAVMSSVLIYNLPETIREADISRLSFAVELAEEFYGRVKGQDVAFEPAKLLWLIQRDFLQGKSVQEMVDEALRRVPNSNGDKNIDQVNQIRDSLAIMGDNSTAFSLPQVFAENSFTMSNAILNRIYNDENDPVLRVKMQCKHGDLLSMQTSWSEDNPARRFWSCPHYRVCPIHVFLFFALVLVQLIYLCSFEEKSCNFFRWRDPKKTDLRLKTVIPRLAKRITELQKALTFY